MQCYIKEQWMWIGTCIGKDFTITLHINVDFLEWVAFIILYIRYLNICKSNHNAPDLYNITLYFLKREGNRQRILMKARSNFELSNPDSPF